MALLLYSPISNCKKFLRVITIHGTVCYSLFLLFCARILFIYFFFIIIIFYKVIKVTVTHPVLLITDLIVYQTISSNFITWHCCASQRPNTLNGNRST
jgi:hypothetical protein